MADRGRPRKSPDELAKWSPPAGWSRLVVWVSEDERRALKRVALEADTSVAALVRALANGLAQGAIASEDVLRPYRRGVAVMEKIPTIFDRDDDFTVMNRVRK